VQLHWSEEILADLRSIRNYIMPDSPDAAFTTEDEIITHAKFLAQFKEMGKPGRIRGTRELVVPSTPYIVLYKLDGEHVYLLRVFHGAQRWPKRL
jgi:toxin ParE1/3/4